MTLNNLGNVLRDERQFPAARKAYEEAAGIYRELAEVEPHIYRPYVATTLNNLGSVLREERQFPAARKACEEAGGIYRDLAEVEPHIYRPDVAMSLNNLGTVLSEERQFPAARKAFEEALEIRRELAAEEPPIYGPDVGMTLNNLGNVLEEMGLAQDAGKASLESVRGAEAGVGDPRSVHLGKGNAVAAYRRIARHFASEGSADRLFRTLGAMREGPVRALGDDPGEGLEAARDALEEAGRRVGQEIRILIPQGLTGDGLLMGVLEVKERSLKWERADEFGKARSALFEQILKVFDKKGRRPYEEGAERIRELGKRAWDALPELVRETLCPEAKHDVLVSGDTYWAAFPWEALWCGGEEKEEGFLGLRRHLARWGPLTAGGLGALGRKAFGKGKRTAAVLCPWNAVLERPLPYSRAEAEEIEERLNGAGYLLIPGGRALVGDQANAEAIKSVLGGNPSLIHYTGHGHIVGNEEVLLLSGAPGEGKYSGLPSHFGREEIIAVRAGIERAGKLLEDGALVVLNSCLTGRTREFGGQREDLAWAFLEEGAGAVIASALPVLDDMGAAFGELLYFDRGGEEDSRGMAWRFAAARGFVERIWRHTKSPYWPAWSLFTYHGNPYARLPHIVHGEAAEQRRGEEGRRGSLFARMAKVMGLRDGAEVERAFEEVRSRLG